MTAITIPVVHAAFLAKAVARGGGANVALVHSPSSQLYKRWFELSEIARFFVSGNIGNMFFYLIEKAINNQLCNASSLPAFIEEYKDTVSFFVGYLLQIAMQHLLNAVLVYGLDTIGTREKYFKTLLGQYSAYGFSLIGSTLFNLILLRLGVEKTAAFFVTMATFACINYFIIGWIVRRASTTSMEKKSDKNNYSVKSAGRISRGGHLRDSLQCRRGFCGSDAGDQVDMEEVNACVEDLPKEILYMIRRSLVSTYHDSACL